MRSRSLLWASLVLGFSSAEQTSCRSAPGWCWSTSTWTIRALFQIILYFSHENLVLRGNSKHSTIQMRVTTSVTYLTCYLGKPRADYRPCRYHYPSSSQRYRVAWGISISSAPGLPGLSVASRLSRGEGDIPIQDILWIIDRENIVDLPNLEAVGNI